MKHKHVKIYFFNNTPKYSNNGEMKINPSSCVATTTSDISGLILKTGQAIKNLLAAYRMNGRGSIMSMMNWVMSILSVKCVLKQSFIHGGQIAVKHVRKMSVGALTTTPVHLTGRHVLQMHVCINNNCLVIMHK